jgi:PAS domain S-box-containing protein
VKGAFADKDIVGLCVCGENDQVIYRRTLSEIPASLIETCLPPDSLELIHEGNLCIAVTSVSIRGRTVGDMWIAFSKESMQQRIRSSVTTMLALSGMVLVIIVIVGSIISRRIVKPIKLFEAASERIRSGDMVSSIEVPTLHKDFLSLGKAFNGMQGTLRSAFEELRHAKDTLEEEVQARTAELKTELSERKKAERSLKFTQFSIDHAADTAFWMGPTARILYVNEAACTTLGYTREELLTMTVHDLDPNFPKETWDAHWQEVKERGSFTIETVHKARDGQLIPVEVTVNFMEYSGREYNCAFVRNITERKQAEEHELELREQLERAERMESLGILAGGVAHDLNNMLGPLVGYPELILMKLPDDSPVRKQVERVGRAAKDAADVIQDLLTLARRGRYEMQPTDLNDVVNGYLDSPSYGQLCGRHPEVEVEIDLRESPPIIQGSSPHLAKVIMNLVVNAFDAMPNGGNLHVQTTCESLTCLLSGYDQIEPGEYILFRVRDTGTGIAEEDLARIFEPYYSKKVMDTSGSGLGLSVVYGVVKDHHGYYDVLSKVGEGTEFILYFPVCNESQYQTGRKSIIEGGTEKILVIDDSVEQRELATAVLSSLGYDVTTAENGAEGVKFLQENQVDLILLDMIMDPGFDGLDTYTEILKLHPGQKAIIVSGFAANDRVEQTQRLGAGAYVKKPYKRNIIAEAVRQELDRVPAPVQSV